MSPTIAYTAFRDVAIRHVRHTSITIDHPQPLANRLVDPIDSRSISETPEAWSVAVTSANTCEVVYE